MVFVIAEKCAEAEALKHLSQAVGDKLGACATVCRREIGSGCYANVTGSPLYAGLWRGYAAGPFART